MSYVPYTPGTATSPDAPVASGKRSWRRYFGWLLFTLFVIAPPVAYYTWRFVPRTAAPPIASISLPDGRELRLIRARQSQGFEVSNRDDFGGRIVIEHDPFTSSHTTGADSPSSYWLAFTLYHPPSRSFTIPNLEQFEVLEENGPARFMGRVAFGPASGRNSNISPVNGVSFDALPRRTPNLKLRFQLGSRPVEATISNPFFHPNAPHFTAENVPARKEIDGVLFDLLKVTATDHKYIRDGHTFQATAIDTVVTAKFKESEKLSLSIQKELFDPTGNVIQRGTLPSADRVWGVRVVATEGFDFPYPPERRLLLGKITVPAPGQAVKLAVPKQLQDADVHEILIFGAGNYALRNGLLTGTTATGSTPSTSVSVSRRMPSNNWSSQDLSLVIYSGTAHPEQRLGGHLRVHCAGVLMSPKSSNSTSSGDRDHTQTFKNYSAYGNRKPSQPSAGDDLEIEFVFPRPRTAEFYFNRPQFPGESK